VRPSLAPLLIVGGLLAVIAGVLLFSLTGLPDDYDNSYWLVAAKVVGEVSSAVAIGSLLFAAFLVPPQRSGVLDVGGYAAVRAAGWAAGLWCLASLVSAVFLAAQGINKPVSELRPRTFVQNLDLLPEVRVALITALIAFVVAVSARFVLTWGWTATVFFVAVVGLLPVAVTGHSSAGGQHDLATNSLIYHLVAAALWVGGLVALLMFGNRVVGREGTPLRVATRRFSALALVCWIVMAASGVINALVRVHMDDLFTPYGLLLLGKVAALLVLGGFGYLQRAKAVRAIEDGGSARPLIRLALGEFVVMFLTFGLASALARTAPPTRTVVPSVLEQQLGYPLDGPPTLGRLLFDWRFDLIYGTAAIVLAALYVAGVRRLAARGDRWPVGRTVAWLAGCAVLLIATSSGFGRYAPGMFSIHMETHMMLSMLAPVLLVLGGPVTLALRAIRPAGPGAPPGPREWLLAAVRSPVSRVLTHPVIALALFVGSFYLLYFSGLFDEALEQHWAHLAMNAHFLLTGYLFYWPVIGVDPSPRRLPHIARLGMVFASLPFHAFFGVILMGMQDVIGERFYQTLALPWASDLLADQRLGGGIAWAAGELPLLLVLVALLVQWARADEREARRRDRKADAEGDAEREAYNAMLRKLSERG
jgi:cytochrome c oxidase assembly factor CtaG/putative copper export protein